MVSYNLLLYFETYSDRKRLMLSYILIGRRVKKITLGLLIMSGDRKSTFWQGNSEVVLIPELSNVFQIQKPSKCILISRCALSKGFSKSLRTSFKYFFKII
jgi:hypothetical protein